MKSVSLSVHNKRFLLPLYGISIFLLLYFFAAALYPGGSNADCISEGYSLWNNYWCDLMADYAKNGHDNPARPVAIIAWVILCLSISLFWIYLPGLFPVKSVNHKIIQCCGTVAMIAAIFSFTKFHDTVINLAGLFGSVTLILAFIEFKKARRFDLLVSGLFCYFLGLVNYFIYTTHLFISKLPVLQKLTYVFCLLTFALGTYRIYYGHFTGQSGANHISQ